VVTDLETRKVSPVVAAFTATAIAASNIIASDRVARCGRAS